ncbi:MAG: ligand-gated channel protein [Proteobacteria bacterium SG_bin9]|nr:MAG: ligand-gated channel protein [Proteobacteria bacterium SG_bin9]
MSSASVRARRLSVRAVLFASTILLLPSSDLAAQTANQPLPQVTVDAPAERRQARPAQPRRGARTARAPRRAVPQAQQTQVVVNAQASALTSPAAEQALRTIQQTPGGVALVPAGAYRNSTPANTIKDVLDYVPGVFAQPKWGDDTRLSIRGSGLSRNFHLRGIQLYQDGVPINTSDGNGDFQEIDPTAYKYVQVYKGANALELGANALGGAINFVTPTGRDPFANGVSVDAGAFGFKRVQANAGGAYGAFDGFITASNQESTGFRDHSFGHSNRASGNIGYQITPDIETRFYGNINEIRQRIPGTVTKFSALNSPQTAAVNNVLNDQQRNLDTHRVANKTTVRLSDATMINFGLFQTERHLKHPIFQFLDHHFRDYGAFANITDDRLIGGFRNRIIAGFNVLNGQNDALQYVNIGGFKGALTASSLDKSKNTSAFVQDSFYILPNVALIGGTQFLYATRDRRDRFLTDGNQGGRTEFNLFSPKGGVLWEIDPTWQAFANVSRSAEVPSFGEGSNALAIPFTSIRAQRATTYEIGTRGRRPDFTWELTGYRAEIRDELQCLTNSLIPGSCNVVNADRTIHQGIEAGAGIAILRSLLVNGPSPDKLWLNAAYTFNDFRFDNDRTFGNNQLPGAPRHFLRAELLYKHPTGVYFGPNIEWVPEAYFVDNANSLKTQSYALFGLKAGFDNGGNYSFYIEARNLANKAYIASASVAQIANLNSTLFEPGNGRAVFVGAKARW